ncbi:MAG: isoleucine--tRNA ligase [Myxococcaceae bacterium]
MSSEPKSDSTELKDTLNLPRTDFPMKGNLAQLEPKLLEWWKSERVYERILEANAQAPQFVLHDGPPYANGHLHAGHALNKTLKDFVVKYRNMAGQLCAFVPGWDTHGLPIEQAVEKRLKDKKIDKRSLSREELLTKCREYAEEFIDIQRTEFQRMGVFGLWEQPYKTLAYDYEAQEIRELATFARKGFLYRKKKPVYFCLTDGTALAEAEVEYEDHASPSVYVAIDTHGDAVAKKWPKLSGKKVSFVIWTTTPWTLPANLAIAVNPKLEYVFYELDGRVLVLAKDLLPAVLKEISDDVQVKDVKLPTGQLQAQALADPTKILGYAAGEELEGLQYRHPFYERISPVILGDHVTLDAGTGLVHTAPGHGQEDYVVGLKYKLDVYNPVRLDGRYDESVGPLLQGKKVFEANPIVIDTLLEKGALLNDKGDSVKHSYPHCWRCHNPIVFLATNQWFISLEHDQFRRRALEEVDRVNWIPAWGRERIRGMLENRPDWCISRQRQWGVPIPVALCEGCEEAVVSPELMEKVAAAVEQEGVAVWYRTPVEEFLPNGFACKCGGKKFRRETDILDVWFDSACSFAAVAEKRRGMKVPVDLYLEGSDQHRGWFHSAMLVAVGTRGSSPYKSCLTHGFVVDGSGQKMSKSRGNVVAPDKIITQHGAEVMRLWVASSDYRDDVRLSEQILKGLSEGYRKVRNTLRYALSNLYDFDPATDSVATEKLQPLDRWVLARLAELTQKVRKAYDQYEFHLVYHLAVDFCATDLSAVYYDISKDRLYTSKATGEKRRSAQTVLYGLTRELLRLLAPVMSFTSEEAWQQLPGKKAPSVFLAGLPTGTELAPDKELMARYEKLFAVRLAVQSLLEEKRHADRWLPALVAGRLSGEGLALINAHVEKCQKCRARLEEVKAKGGGEVPQGETPFIIGASLEAKVLISGAKELLQKHRDELAGLFIVSQVELVEKASPRAVELPGTIGLKAEVVPADGAKCPRCWSYQPEVAKGAQVCAKCAEALKA